METNPYHLGSMINHHKQRIDFYEDSLWGDEGCIICVCHALDLAGESGFYDMDDMTSEVSDEYYPWFDHNENLRIGEI